MAFFAPNVASGSFRFSRSKSSAPLSSCLRKTKKKDEFFIFRPEKDIQKISPINLRVYLAFRFNVHAEYERPQKSTIDLHTADKTESSVVTTAIIMSQLAPKIYEKNARECEARRSMKEKVTHVCARFLFLDAHAFAIAIYFLL